MVTIRSCTTDDLAGLLDLYRELRPHDPPLSGEGARTALEVLLADPRVRLLVAEVEGVLAATCQLGMVSTLTNGARPFGIIEHVITGGPLSASWPEPEGTGTGACHRLGAGLLQGDAAVGGGARRRSPAL